MASVDVVQGGCIEVLRALDAESVDAIVCDPPYGLEFMGKEWDNLGAGFTKPGFGERPIGWQSGRGWNEARCGACGLLIGHGGSPCRCAEPVPVLDKTRWRAMQEWHHAWALEAFRVLKPGGHLIAASGSRTYHRLACAVEDAGFEVREMLEWTYGSGFPKSLDVSKAIDKAERPVIEQCRVWEGWGTALKPAHEPFILARKPLIGTVAANVLKYGTGGLNINGCRVATTDNLNGGAYSEGGRAALPGDIREGAAAGMFEAGKGRLPGQYAPPEGRWPPNVLLSHSPDCKCVGTKVVKGDNRTVEEIGGTRPGGFADVGAEKEDGKPNAAVYGDSVVPVYACVPGCPVAALDAQSGPAGAAARASSPKGVGRHDHGIYQPAALGFRKDGYGSAFYADSGGASRFFPILNWDPEYDAPFLYCAKPARKEREAGCENLPGTSAARRNNHPTVKPVNLMRWLLRLVVPPGGFFVDPFAGSGTTGVAALLEGMDGLLIEKEAAYVPIIEARLAHARAKAK